MSFMMKEFNNKSTFLSWRLKSLLLLVIAQLNTRTFLLNASGSHLSQFDQSSSSSSFGEPIFRLQPPSVIKYSNLEGTTIHCLASGSPRPMISWYASNFDTTEQSWLGAGASFQDIIQVSTNTPSYHQKQTKLVSDVPNLIQISPNGAALSLLPFKQDDYRPEIHSTEYRCVASNYVATIHSRSVQVQVALRNLPAANEQLAQDQNGNSSEQQQRQEVTNKQQQQQHEWVKVNDEFVQLNAPAVLRCRPTEALIANSRRAAFSSSSASDLGNGELELLEWFTSDNIHVRPNELFGAGGSSNQAAASTPVGKFVAFKSGELHLSSVQSSDLKRTYGCRLRAKIINNDNRLNGGGGATIDQEQGGDIFSSPSPTNYYSYQARTNNDKQQQQEQEKFFKIYSSSGLAQLIVSNQDQQQPQQQEQLSTFQVLHSSGAATSTASQQQQQPVIALDSRAQLRFLQEELTAGSQQHSHHLHHQAAAAANNRPLLLACAVRHQKQHHQASQQWQQSSLSHSSTPPPSSSSTGSSNAPVAAAGSWFYQPASRGATPIPLEQWAAELGMPAPVYLGSSSNNNNNNNNFAGAANKLVAANKTAPALTSHYYSTPPPRFLVGATFLAIEWPISPLSGHYIYSTVLKQQQQQQQIVVELDEKLCDIELLVREPIALKVELAPPTETSTDNNNNNNGEDEERGARAEEFLAASQSKVDGGSTATDSFLSRAVDWLSARKPQQHNQQHQQLQRRSQVNIKSTQVTATTSDDNNQRFTRLWTPNDLLDSDPARLQVHSMSSGTGTGMFSRTAQQQHQATATNPRNPVIQAPALIKVGQRLEINCLALAGHPIESVKWFKNGLAINTQSSNDFQTEIRQPPPRDFLQRGDADTQVQVTGIGNNFKHQPLSSAAAATSGVQQQQVLSSLVISQVQSKDVGLQMFECFASNSLGDRARAGLALFIVTSQMIDQARSQCPAPMRGGRGRGHNTTTAAAMMRKLSSSSQQTTSEQYESVDNYLKTLLPAKELEPSSQIPSAQEVADTILWRHNPFKQALVLEHEPIELICPLGAAASGQLNQLQYHQSSSTQTITTSTAPSARHSTLAGHSVEWRRWTGQQQQQDKQMTRSSSPALAAAAANELPEQARLEQPTAGGGATRNFNQLFSQGAGDSRFVINGSSLQIRSPSARGQDEAIYACGLMMAAHTNAMGEFADGAASSRGRRQRRLRGNAGPFLLLANHQSSSSILNAAARGSSTQTSRLQEVVGAADRSSGSSRSQDEEDGRSNVVVNEFGEQVKQEEEDDDGDVYECAQTLAELMFAPETASPSSSRSQVEQQKQPAAGAEVQAAPTFKAASAPMMMMSSISIRIVGKPKIDPFEFSRNLEEGMRAVIVCAVLSGQSPVDIVWFKDSQLLEAQAQQQQQAHEQDNQAQPLSLTVDQTNGFSSTLTFHRIQAQHSGLYTCVASNAFGSASHQSRLTVNVAPYFLDPPKNTRALLSSNVLVNCRAAGEPNPQIRWRKLVPIGQQQQQLQAQSSTLLAAGGGKFAGSVAPPGGNYLKQLAAAVASGQDSAAGLDYTFYSDFGNPPPLGSSSQGTQVAAQQQVSPATATKYEFRVITSNSHIQILENGSMLIKDLDLSDESRYICQAFNGVNPSLSEMIQLTVLSPPQFADSPLNYETLSVKRDSMIKFNCAPKGDQPMSIEWRKESSLLRPMAGGVAGGVPANQEPATGEQVVPTKYTQMVHYAAPAEANITNSGGGGASEQSLIRHSNLVMVAQQQQQDFSNRSTTSNDMATVPASAGSFGSPAQNQQQAQQLEPGMRSSELLINYADRSDSGLFVCVARNAYGRDELQYRLFVQEPPDTPMQLSAHQVGPTHLKLTWLAPFDGNLPLSHFVIEYRKAAVMSTSGSGGVSIGSQALGHHQSAGGGVTSSILLYQAAASGEWTRIIVSITTSSNSKTSSSSSSSSNVQLVTEFQMIQGSQQQPQSGPLQVPAAAGIQPAAGSSFSAVLRQLSPLTTYHIRLAAANALGQSAYSSHLTVTTAEEAPTQRANDVRTEPLSSSSIRVLWRGPGLMDEQAPIKGYYVSHRKMGVAQPHAGTSLLLEQSLLEQLSGSSGASSSSMGSNSQQQQQPNSWIATYSVRATNTSGSGMLSGDTPTSYLAFDAASESSKSSGGTANSLRRDRVGVSGPGPGVGGMVGGGGNYEFILGSLEKNTKYEIRLQPYNSMGVGPATEVVGQTLKFDRPSTPLLELVGVRRQSFELKWSLSDPQQPLLGFSIFYKCEYDDWQEIQLGVIYQYVIENLRCGNKYQIYLSAFNVVGRSEPSDVLNVRTEGTTPVAPEKNDFIRSNRTEVVLDMGQWRSGGCPISSFMIQFKRFHESTWFILSEGATPFANSERITIPDLTQATWYKLLVTAINEAGSTNAEYLFSTLTHDGQQIAPITLPSSATSSNQMGVAANSSGFGQHPSSGWLMGGAGSNLRISLWSSLMEQLFGTGGGGNNLDAGGGVSLNNKWGSSGGGLNQHQQHEQQLAATSSFLMSFALLLMLTVSLISLYLYHTCRRRHLQQQQKQQQLRANNHLQRNIKNSTSENLHHDSMTWTNNNNNNQANTCSSTGGLISRSASQMALKCSLVGTSQHHQHQHLLLQQQQQQQQLDSLIGIQSLQQQPGTGTGTGTGATGLTNDLSPRLQPQQQHHALKLFSNVPTTGHTHSSNCTSSSMSTHSTNCFDPASGCGSSSVASSAATATSGGNGACGSGKAAKLQLIDESSMIFSTSPLVFGGVGEAAATLENNSSSSFVQQKPLDGATNQQHYYQYSMYANNDNHNTDQSSGTGARMYHNLDQHHHLELINMTAGGDGGSATAAEEPTSSAAAQLVMQDTCDFNNNPSNHRRRLIDLNNNNNNQFDLHQQQQRGLFSSSSFASAADLIHRQEIANYQQQQQQQHELQDQQHTTAAEEPIYQRLDRSFQTYAALCIQQQQQQQQQQHLNNLGKAQTLRLFNAHHNYSFDEPSSTVSSSNAATANQALKSMTLHRAGRALYQQNSEPASSNQQQQQPSAFQQQQHVDFTPATEATTQAAANYQQQMDGPLAPSMNQFESQFGDIIR